MGYRENQSRIQWQAQIEAEENAARIERERPLREAEDSFKHASRQLAELERERVRSGTDEFSVDSAVADARMSFEEANRWNGEQAALFVDATPEYYPSDENQARLISYLESHGAMICNKATFEAAFEKLRAFSLLEEWPIEQEPEPLPVPILIEQGRPLPVQRLYDGWGTNGEPRQYTEYEINQLTSEELRKALRIPHVNQNHPYSERRH
jgi:hypothetical protein